MLAFIGQVAWQARAGGSWKALTVGLVIVVEVIVLGAVYPLNQLAARSELCPRRQERKALFDNLGDRTR
jgi:hypothetical protein